MIKNNLGLRLNWAIKTHSTIFTENVSLQIIIDMSESDHSQMDFIQSSAEFQYIFLWCLPQTVWVNMFYKPHFLFSIDSNITQNDGWKVKWDYQN